jgi:protein SCO1/2
MAMKRKLLLYGGFFAVLVFTFWYFLYKDRDFSQSYLPVINNDVKDFAFVNQNGKTITEKDVDGKVYVAEYFFTTCQGICPKMNANMRRVFDEYKDEQSFMIVSHSCMPETDSVPLLKAYEQKMINGQLVKAVDGSYKIVYDTLNKGNAKNTIWNFVTGDKSALYKMARQSYMIDNNKADTSAIKDQFIHTQFFALVDKQRRVRAIYDGLKEDEIQKLISDIKGLLKEKITTKRFMNGFDNNPG